VTAEEITEKELTSGDGIGNTFLPSIDVDMVVHLPWGAHPCSCGFFYDFDEAHLREYIEAAQEEEKFKSYLQKYAVGVKDHEDYLQRVGIKTLLTGGRAHV
jgi:hypothetical protein